MAKRKHTISVRMNDEELALLNSWRGKMTKGRWIRNRLFLNQPAIPPAIAKEQWAAFGKIGSNLNQIARRLNQGQKVDIDRINTEIDLLRRALMGLKK